MSRTKIIQIGLEALCLQWPAIKNWANLPNDILFKIGLTRIDSMEKGSIYLPKDIEEKINKILETRYYNEMLRSRYHYIDNKISLNETLYCQYGILDSILLSY